MKPWIKTTTVILVIGLGSIMVLAYFAVLLGFVAFCACLFSLICVMLMAMHHTEGVPAVAMNLGLWLIRWSDAVHRRQEAKFAENTAKVRAAASSISLVKA